MTSCSPSCVLKSDGEFTSLTASAILYRFHVVVIRGNLVGAVVALGYSYPPAVSSRPNLSAEWLQICLGGIGPDRLITSRYEGGPPPDAAAPLIAQ